MKQIMALLLSLVTMTAAWLVLTSMAENSSAYVLPGSLETVGEEAFAGNATLTSVMIPNTVRRIDAWAFANCDRLTEVIFGNNAEIDIDKDAFMGCGDIHFYAFSNTPAELFALSHGFECDLIEEGNSFLQRALTLISENGGTTSILQSGEFSAKRLIVKTNGSRLPDISQYAPTQILRSDDGFFLVQFSTVDDTAECYSFLKQASEVSFVEADACEEVIDDVEAAGYVYSKTWDTTDPMGFDVYAPFVAENSSRRVTIAVIDSGIEKKSAYNQILRSDGISLVSGEPEWTTDFMRHGSVITGIIKDCIGDANVDVLPVRVVGRNGVASLTMIALGIQYSMEHGADIINLSLKCEENRYIRYWIDRAIDAGIQVVVAAGNSSRDVSKSFPANVPGVIAVSGIDSDYMLSAISNYGENIRFCAPDTDIVCSAYNGTRTGTSFAAPMVASAYALVKLDIYHSESDLIESCRKLVNAVGNNTNNYGHGLMQLSKLARIDVADIGFDEGIKTRIPIGWTDEISYSILPTNATDQSVTVTCDDSTVLNVITVAGGARVEGIARGTATVTVRANNGGGKWQPEDTITFQVIQPVNNLTISVPKTRLALGKTMKATVVILPEDSDERDFDWDWTSRSGEITITEDGTITAIKTGQVSLCAIMRDEENTTSNKVTIDIVDIPDAESVVLTEASGMDISSGSVRVDPGSDLKLIASVLPEDAEQDVTWTCSSEPTDAVVVDENGNVTTSGVGRATITATTENGIEASLTVLSNIPPVKLTLSGGQTIDIGNTTNISVGYEPSNTTEKDIVWTSDNTSVAMVSQSGLVTGVGMGSANITAMSAADNIVSTSIIITVRQPYMLNFDANGGTVSQTSKRAYSGTPIGTRPTASRTGYTFAGWYTASSGGSQVTESSSFNSSSYVTVYAHWTANTYTVTYNANGGSVSSGSKSVTYDSTYGSLATATRTGYTFAGWYTAASGGSKITSTTKMTTASNHPLYAHWTANKYTYSIVYRSSNGTNLGSSSATYTFGTTNTITPPGKAGYYTPGAQSVKWDATTKTITFSYSPVPKGFVSSEDIWSTGPTMLYYAEVQHQNRTANSVDIRVIWSNAIIAYSYNANQMRFSGWCNGVGIPDTEIVPYGAWRSSVSYERNADCASPWVRVGLNTTGETSVTAHLEMYQYNSMGVNMYDDHGASRVILDLNVPIPAY